VLQIEFHADLEAPAKARRECTARTQGVVSLDVATTACLLVSELVTNTVRHGDCRPDDTLEVLIEREPECLRVAVCQRAVIGALQVATDREGREGGWGLMLVDELAAEWGVENEPNCVWFRLAA
jgi:two-component sensor histidine kinase